MLVSSAVWLLLTLILWSIFSSIQCNKITSKISQSKQQQQQRTNTHAMQNNINLEQIFCWFFSCGLFYISFHFFWFTGWSVIIERPNCYRSHLSFIIKKIIRLVLKRIRLCQEEQIWMNMIFRSKETGHHLWSNIEMISSSVELERKQKLYFDFGKYANGYCSNENEFNELLMCNH